MPKTLSEAIKEALAQGDIKIEIKCKWCGLQFSSIEDFEGHLIEGKTFDADGKRRLICPHPQIGSPAWKKAKEAQNG